MTGAWWEYGAVFATSARTVSLPKTTNAVAASGAEGFCGGTTAAVSGLTCGRAAAVARSRMSDFIVRRVAVLRLPTAWRE